MSEKRFEFKLKVNFIDEETGEEIYHKILIDNSNGNEIGFDDMVGLLNELAEENEQLRKQCFELEKDYLIETSDISDKIYLGDEIKELKQRYGVDDE